MIVDHRTKDKASPLLSLKATLCLFKRLVRFIASACLDGFDQVYFRDTYAPSNRLKPLAHMAQRLSLCNLLRNSGCKGPLCQQKEIAALATGPVGATS